MMSRWKRAWVAARQPDPPKKPTRLEIVVTVVACAVVIGALGLITGMWDALIVGGIGGRRGSSAVPVVARPHRPARGRGREDDA